MVMPTCLSRQSKKTRPGEILFYPGFLSGSATLILAASYRIKSNSNTRVNSAYIFLFSLKDSLCMIKASNSGLVPDNFPEFIVTYLLVPQLEISGQSLFSSPYRFAASAE
jgi:hypothetical protein